MGIKGIKIKKSIIFTVLTAVLIGFIAFVEKTESAKTYRYRGDSEGNK